MHLEDLQSRAFQELLEILVSAFLAADIDHAHAKYGRPQDRRVIQQLIRNKQPAVGSHDPGYNAQHNLGVAVAVVVENVSEKVDGSPYFARLGGLPP